MSQYNSTIVNQQPVGGYPPAPSPLRQSGGGRNPHSAHSSPSAQPAGPFPGAVPPSASNLFGVRPPEPLQIPSINSNPSPNPPPSSYSAPMPPPVGPPHIAAAGLGFQQAPLLPPSASVQHSDTVISAPVPPPVQSYTPTSYMQPNQASMTNTRIIQPGT